VLDPVQRVREELYEALACLMEESEAEYAGDDTSAFRRRTIAHVGRALILLRGMTPRADPPETAAPSRPLELMRRLSRDVPTPAESGVLGSEGLAAENGVFPANPETAR